MAPPLQVNCYITIILTAILTCTFNVLLITQFCVTELSTVNNNALCVFLLCFTQNMYSLTVNRCYGQNMLCVKTHCKLRQLALGDY
jgi:hypothetical protein